VPKARIAIATAVGASLTLAACGSGSSSGGATQLSWFIGNQPGGAVTALAKSCSQQSGGRYTIKPELLPNASDQQREQLVRRLGAKDTSLDLMGLDVVWTGEFANAGWIRPVPEATRRIVSQNVFDSVLQTARFKNRLYAVPIWSNTQLLLYRMDRVQTAPKTWDQMLDAAEKLGPSKGRVQVQANRYEGLVVLVNQLIESAGTHVLAGPTKIQLAKAPTERALAILGRLSRSPIAPPNLTTSTEDTARQGFESGDSAFMVNYPFVYASAKSNAPKVYRQMGAAVFPGIDAAHPGKPPIGGINLGISSYSKHTALAFEAAKCLVKPANQLKVTELEGLPPVRSDLYDRPQIKKAYPTFGNLIATSIKDAAPRPSQSPAYQDLSLAIQRAVHPTTQIDPKSPDGAYNALRGKVLEAIQRKGLL